MLRLVGVSLLLPVLAAACGPRAVPPDQQAALVEAHVDPGPLLPHTDLREHIFWRQRVTATWPEGEQSFEAVLQRDADALQLVGLSPVGPPAFVVRHGADGVSFENHSDRELPFAPSFMIADVQKAFYPWLPLPANVRQGEYRDSVRGLVVTEGYVDDALQWRTFVRVDDPEARELRVTYEPPVADGLPPVAVLENGWFGYTLTVETLEARRLE